MRFETTHDNQLNELLAEVYAASTVRAEEIHRLLIRTATVYVGSDRTYRVGRESFKDSDMPVGTVYQQAKTWTRGEAGVYVMTEKGRRPATVADIAPEFADRVAAVTATVEAATQAVAAHETGYTGWTRYILVTNGSGHVHKNTCCSTLRPTTQIAQVTSLSGLDAATAIAQLGQVMCTVCFPEAPSTGKLTKAAAKAILAGNMTEAEEIADAVCPGSLTEQFDRATARMGFYSGNAGDCGVCGSRVSLTKANRLRSHNR